MSILTIPYKLIYLMLFKRQEKKEIIWKTKMTYYCNGNLLQKRCFEKIPINKFYNATDLIEL